MEGRSAGRIGIGADVGRVEGALKVTGRARYASDFAVPTPIHAVLVTSRIARGRIAAIHETGARGIRGVHEILTYRNVGDRIAAGSLFSEGGHMGTTIAPLASDAVRHDGQIVAVVLAESLEIAREAAHRLSIEYDAEEPAGGFDSPGAETLAASEASEGHEDPAVGDAAAAFERAPVKIDAEYETPTQHHNPLELFTTTCAWEGDRLTIWEASQNVRGLRQAVAEQLGIDPAKVRVVSPHVGGAFGSRGSATQRTALIAFAARRLGRPVKLVATRDQGFTIATYRAETRHRVKLAADRDGRLQSLSHEGWEVTSRPDPYTVAGTDTTTRLYACPNVSSKVSMVRADRNTPGFMRSPPEVPYLFALESAMDELAVALDMDPIELRRVNDTRVEPIRGLRYTSRSLMACFDAGAKYFGWAERDRRPGNGRDGEWLVGTGCATSVYPTVMAPATARVVLEPGGRVRVETGAHDMGTGAYTAIALTAADRLGVALDKVEVVLGDSDLPPAPLAGGSNTTASVCTVVAKACEQIRRQIAEKAVAANDSPFTRRSPDDLALDDGAIVDSDGRREDLETAMSRVTSGALEVHAENVPHGVEPDAVKTLYRGKAAMNGGAWLDDRVQFAFGACFVEVRINRHTGELRCPRILGAYATGQIVSRRTAESQLMGGLIWGVSSALHEATEIDRRAARYYNTDFAEYLIPVNADIGEVKVMLLPETDDAVNDIGIKGLGELGNVGVNAAVANAVFHATGRRIRRLPIRLENVIEWPT